MNPLTRRALQIKKRYPSKDVLLVQYNHATVRRERIADRHIFHASLGSTAIMGIRADVIVVHAGVMSPAHDAWRQTVLMNRLKPRGEVIIMWD